MEHMHAGPFYTAAFHLEKQWYRGEKCDTAIEVAFSISGGVVIELVHQLDDSPSVWREVLETRGEGFHHLMYRDMDYDEQVQHFEKQGCAVAHNCELPDGTRFALLDTRAIYGGFIEVMDWSTGISTGFERIYDAHKQWDGKTDPVRTFESLYT
jgi:hypothetical protein